MRKVRDVLRLRHHVGLSLRQIARTLDLAHSTVCEYLQRAERAGLSWPLPEHLDETRLDRMLFPTPAPSREKRPEPDWRRLHHEMRRKGMTLQLLWQEYKAEHAHGYQYSRFCDHYRAWRGRLDLVMRQEHRPGEKLFVDYAGQTVAVIDPETGEERQAQIFVAVLGASNYTYAEATWSQALPDWIAAHGRAFSFFGGVPEIVVPDNLKAGVHAAHRYEPDLNPTYQDFALHYGVAVVPARVRRPRDKAKVEAGVQLVERWILAALRHRRFFSLQELNEAITVLLDGLNSRPFQKIEGSRLSLFETLERERLRPLPSRPYVYAEWKKARVHIDYHVEVDHHYYSVPYQYARQELDVRLSAATVECFHRGRRVASHARSSRRGRHTTVKEHMPASHRHWADWTPERIIDWAAKTGPATADLVAKIVASRPHVQQAYRTCLGILRLGEAHGAERLEKAAHRALSIGATSYKSVASILKNGLETQPFPAPAEPVPIQHDNLRGASYYTHHIKETKYEC